ncbi:MAG: DNA-processing protein DprA [Gammaproteobacteria bacterium]|nr:DNA-processing protein DprA [Gammaproteobacteria bacterium]
MKDLRHWLALLRTPSLEPKKTNAVLDVFGTPEALFSPKTSFPESLRLPPKVQAWLRDPDWSKVEDDLQWMEQAGCRLVTMESPEYPQLLKTIDDPPPALFVKGDAHCLQYTQLAVVGSRNPTIGGSNCAKDFATYLARVGLTITSGLAAGIDSAAHRGAIAAGGTTVAVCGTGLDTIYPRENVELAEAIQETGALVSEYPPGMAALPQNFPRRNRIISGLSVGTLVVEAAQRSGSLITARLAAEQGREVFAIPGSVNNLMARGCHKLIRDGAKLVETAADILEELGPLVAAITEVNPKTFTGVKESHPPTKEVTDPEYETLLKNVGFEPTPVDIIVERTGLKTDVVSSMLLILELQGRVEAMPGGRYSRVT